MTTSMAAGWLFGIAGFTGLVGMNLLLIRGTRSSRGSGPQRARREAGPARLHEGKDETGLLRARPVDPQ
jgi:hypothetical protein